MLKFGEICVKWCRRHLEYPVWCTLGYWQRGTVYALKKHLILGCADLLRWHDTVALCVHFVWKVYFLYVALSCLSSCVLCPITTKKKLQLELCIHSPTSVSSHWLFGFSPVCLTQGIACSDAYVSIFFHYTPNVLSSDDCKHSSGHVLWWQNMFVLLLWEVNDFPVMPNPGRYRQGFSAPVWTSF